MNERWVLGELESLKRQTNAQARGYSFQKLIRRIFEAKHFRVVNEPGTARPRRSDLLATRGDERYLVEAKWRRGPANSSDIDSLFTRLDSTESSVTGLLVSYAGFTSEVIKRVEENSQRPVLLLSGSELEDTLRRNSDFIRLLRKKKEELLVHRKALLDSKPGRKPKYLGINPDDLPSTTSEFLYPDGRRSRWLTSGGGFGAFAFLPEMPDIDWTAGGGFGVSLDFTVEIWDQNDFFGLMLQLSKLGWLTDQASWSIQQATTNWHGLGARTLVEALQGWRERYGSLDTHHDSEELCYFDTFDDGWYTLTVAISADESRIIRHADFSFQLVGIPLDQKPLHELCERIDALSPVSFRPKNKKSVSRGRPRQAGKLPVVHPIAYVIETSDSDIPGDKEWITGIVIENPFLTSSNLSRNEIPGWVPNMLSHSQYLICRLSSWHTADDLKALYKLREIESSWSSDALVVRPVADWPDVPNKAFRPRDVPPKSVKLATTKDS